MEKSDQPLLTILMTALVAFVVAGATVMALGGGVDFSPKSQGSGTGNVDFINAHECTRDDTCEVNKLAAEGIRANDGEILNKLKVEGLLELTGGFDFTNNSIECRVFTHAGGTGQQTCDNNGFDVCMVGEYEVTTTYYDSAGDSCNGSVQVKMADANIGTCPGLGGSSGGGCGFNRQGVEPYYGDVFTGSTGAVKKVLCCR